MSYSSVVEKPLDVVVPVSPTEDGEGARVVRLKEEEERIRVQAAQIRAVQEGKPIPESAEVIKLQDREDGAYDVETILPPRAPQKGPAQVASDRYRKNWDAIFGPRPN